MSLLRKHGHQVHVRSAAPAKFFVDAAYIEPRYYDIGMLQSDPLRYDVAATAVWYERFIENEPALVAEEVAYGRAHHIGLVLSDMPPIACEVADQLGVPCVVITHFTWDWVYEHYLAREPRFAPIVAHITAQYAKATMALQMPFAHPFPQFRRVESVGLFANPLTKTRHDVRAEFGVPEQDCVALLSMGGHGWGQTDIRALADMKDWTFLVMPDAYQQVKDYAHFRPVAPDYPQYHNLLGNVDLVIGKAGGSTVAEVVAHQTPMLYTLTEDWRECGLLDAALHTYGRSRYLPLAEFERGAWVELLDKVAAIPSPQARLSVHGAEETVEKLLVISR